MFLTRLSVFSFGGLFFFSLFVDGAETLPWATILQISEPKRRWLLATWRFKINKDISRNCQIVALKIKTFLKRFTLVNFDEVLTIKNFCYQFAQQIYSQKKHGNAGKYI